MNFVNNKVVIGFTYISLYIFIDYAESTTRHGIYTAKKNCELYFVYRLMFMYIFVQVEL